MTGCVIMSDKEKDLINEQGEENTAADLYTEDEASKADVEDNATEWKFDGEAKTLSDSFILDDGETAVEFDVSQSVPAPSKPDGIDNQVDEKTITVRTDTIKFVFIGIFFAIVFAVVAVLGVRYYTVPNYNEVMTPGNTAMEIEDVPVSIGMYNYYYTCITQNYITYANYGYYDLDPSVDFSSQTTTDEDGKTITWEKKFENETVEQIRYITAYYSKALESGTKLSKAQQEEMETQLQSLKDSADEEGKALDSYVSDTYGDYCGEATLKKMLEQCYLAENYYQVQNIKNRISDDELDEYAKVHKEDYRTIPVSYLQMTYESEDDIKKAKEYIAKIKSEEDLVNLIPDVCADLIEQYSESYGSDEAVIDAIKDSMETTLSKSDSTWDKDTINWLFDASTKIGNANYTLDEDNGCIYIIVKTGESKIEQDTVYSVRHILIQPETDDESEDSTEQKEYTAEELAAAKSEAEEILKEYNKTDKTEYDFAKLAEKYSKDTESLSTGSSGTFGGLYEGVSKGDMVEEFENWSLDGKRSYGDTGLVESKYGCHIMFFVSAYPEYKAECYSKLKSDKENEFVESYKVTKTGQFDKTKKAEPTSSSSSSVN